MGDDISVEYLCDNIDIVDFISQFVDLREKNGEFWGLSPFSEEKTPSFSVRKESNRFYCFSSGIGGNVFTFAKKYYNCSSREAVDILKKYLGVDGENVTVKAKLDATLVCKKFKPFCNHRKASKIRIYPNDYMKRYLKREDKLKVWENEGISREVLDEFEVYYDDFSDRLVYPIKNLQGEIVNIGGRTLDPFWKEKELRKYTYFSGWGEMSVIYGLFENLDEILRKKEIILFEGCKSVLLARTWGITNCGAILTSHLNPRQMMILVKLGVRVVFALDAEIRIKKDRNITKLKQYTVVEYLWDRNHLLGEKDAPVDKGQEVFNELYESRCRFR